ncbi:TERF1-interacting nuclear factor 2 isoform X1 [Clarias gariepinus]|uniref:TERF1-interacting nuclear factor 2 isoform X1 n=2 Tax=Clarias gariepinus TaxID=13013 RepID=UPI00234E0166|nr:TERF1-interacting nuclear factor 2 isoform X1 [Clarias gariepinus]
MRSGTTRNRNNNNNSGGSSSNDDSLPIASLRLLAPPLRLVSAAMWKVMQQRDALHYGKLEEFVTSVSETVPGLLSYRHQAKLTVGLRARLILEQLHLAQSPELILPQLEKLRAPALSNSKRSRADQKVEMAVNNFHTLVQTLLKNPAEREQFFKEEFNSQYGPHYDFALEKLLWEFLTRLDQLLPVPDLAQTVSWLTAAPAVLEECARSASQPQLLRTLLQHEKCLGHINSAASVLSSTGDSILSSLSLPLSGKVRDRNQSGSSPLPNIIPSTAKSAQKSNNRQTRGTMSNITPVIGSISTADVPLQTSTRQNVASISENDSEEEDTEASNYIRAKLRSCQKSGILDKVPDEEHCVGKLLVTVISQTPTPTSSEVEEEDEAQIGPARRSSEKIGEKDERELGSGNKMPVLGKKKRKREDGSKTTQKNSQDTKPQEEDGLHPDIALCMKRQLRVIIPRLKMKDYSQTVLLKTKTEGECATVSAAIDDVSAVKNANAGKRKRKLSLSATPEKNLISNTDKQVYAGSPCIPTLMPLRMENSDTGSPVGETPEDVIVDSEDEATEKVKGRLFTKRYCKTKSDTYIPTLHEFWTPAFFRRDLLSPGNACR